MTITVIPHALFKNYCECHNSCSLSGRTVLRVAVAGLFCIGALVALGCLSTPISYIVGGILAGIGFVILALVILALIFGEKKLPPIPRVIPDGFIKVIGSTYSTPIALFVKKQQLTLAEFRQFATVLVQQITPEEKIKLLPEELQSKVEKYGIGNLMEDMERSDWRCFEEILEENCPLYWLQKFVSAGDQKVCKNLGIPKKCWGYYWLGPLGHSQAKGTVFSPGIHSILTKLKEEEFVLLKDHALKGTWDRKEVKEIISRICNDCKGESGALLDIEKVLTIFSEEKVSNDLLLFSVHGCTYDQVQLITALPKKTWNWFCFIDNIVTKNLQLCLLGGALFSQELIDECSKAFDINLALYPIRELEKASRVLELSKDPAQQMGRFLLQHLSLASKRLESILRQGLHLRTIADGEKKIPVYEINFITGSRSRISEKTLPINKKIG